MNVKEYAEHIECKIFSKRDTLAEAIEYAQRIAKGTENPVAVMTALGVVMNTVAHELKNLEDDAPNDPVALGEILGV